MFIAIVVVAAVILFDRFTKSFFSELLSVGESLPIFYNVFHLTLVHNTGIAFGFLRGQGSIPIVMTVIAFALLIFNIYYYKKNDEALTRSYIVAFSLIFGGAIGNLVDRITLGYVVDFIDFRVWPVFNVADSAITIGAVVILFKCFQVSTK